MRNKAAIWGIGLALLVAGICVAATTVWVHEDSVPVREEADRFANLVAEVERGTALEVLGDDGDWFNVKLRDGRTGWALKDSMTTTQPATGSARLSGGLDSTIRSSSTDDTVRASGARGGLPYDGSRYTDMQGDFGSIQWMESQKDSIVGAGMVEKFVKEGKLR
ncbi:MAG: SH3 domain-containing protein [Planctomycetota bacterium]|nr:SH3 domain-containing protein [Planctomycetota bacterium]